MTEHSTTQPRWLSIDEAASYLSMSVGTLRSLMADQRIAYYQLSNRVVRFRLADVDAYLQATRVGPTVADLVGSHATPLV